VRLDAVAQNDGNKKDIGRNNEYDADQISEMNLVTSIERGLSLRWPI
jgi:hypothetical protein